LATTASLACPRQITRRGGLPRKEKANRPPTPTDQGQSEARGQVTRWPGAFAPYTSRHPA